MNRGVSRSSASCTSHLRLLRGRRCPHCCVTLKMWGQAVTGKQGAGPPQHADVGIGQGPLPPPRVAGPRPGRRRRRTAGPNPHFGRIELPRRQSRRHVGGQAPVPARRPSAHMVRRASSTPGCLRVAVSAGLVHPSPAQPGRLPTSRCRRRRRLAPALDPRPPGGGGPAPQAITPGRAPPRERVLTRSPSRATHAAAYGPPPDHPTIGNWPSHKWSARRSRSVAKPVKVGLATGSDPP